MDLFYFFSVHFFPCIINYKNTNKNDYKFADINESCKSDIDALESTISNKLNKQIAIVAYEHSEEE